MDATVIRSLTRTLAARFTAALWLALGVTPAAAQEPLSYTWGSDSAAVVVVEFLDLGCSACAEFHRESYASLFNEYVTTEQVRWTLVPFVSGQFPGSMEAAEAASCAAHQPGGLTLMVATLLDTQQEWMVAPNRIDMFRRFAEELGLDGAALDACIRDHRTEAGIRTAGERARDLGVRVTPTFFMDGFPIPGALPLEFFRELFDKQIERNRRGGATQPAPGG